MNLSKLISETKFLLHNKMSRQLSLQLNLQQMRKRQGPSMTLYIQAWNSVRIPLRPRVSSGHSFAQNTIKLCKCNLRNKNRFRVLSLPETSRLISSFANSTYMTEVVRRIVGLSTRMHMNGTAPSNKMCYLTLWSSALNLTKRSKWFQFNQLNSQTSSPVRAKVNSSSESTS